MDLGVAIAPLGLQFNSEAPTIDFLTLQFVSVYSIVAGQDSDRIHK